MSGKFAILSYCEHVTGTCNINPIKRFDTVEEAIAYFELNRDAFQDHNPIYFTIACEQEDGSFRDLAGNRI